MDTAPDVTTLLIEWRRGNRAALDRVVELVHHELHRLAHRCMFDERRDHALQTTALINEVYVRLVDVTRVDWRDRTHFITMCGRIMRRILVDFARSPGEWALADAHFDAAFEQAQAAPLPIAHAHACLWRGQLLGRRGPETSEPSLTLLEQAISSFESLNMPSFAATARRAVTDLA
jgi:hypothetical protein